MNKTKILIVEDDGILAVYLQRMISRLGYTVKGPVATGEDAVAAMGGQDIDLVLMDIELAGAMDGIAAAGIISRTHEVPIIFLSGFSQDPLLEQAQQVSPYGYLVKPVNERELDVTIKMAIHRHAMDRMLNESRLALEKSEAKYRNLFESLPLGIFRTSLEGKILDGNREMAKILGCTSLQDSQESIRDIAGQVYVNPVKRQEFISLLQKHGEVKKFEFQARKKSREIIWISMNARIKLEGASEEPVIEGFAEDITSRRRSENALRLIAESGYAKEGDIFRFLVKLLATSQEKHYVMISRIVKGDAETAHTVAVWQNGAFAEDFSYSLTGTPCEQVVTLGGYFCADNLKTLFPEDSLITLLGAKSYWGVPLRDSSGKILGILALLDNQAMEGRSETFSMLTSIAARAASELERRMTQEKYQLLFNEMLEGFALHEIILDEAGKPVDYRFLDVNPAFEVMTGMLRSEVVGKTALEVMPQLEPYWVETYGKVALTGEPAHFENFSRELGRHFKISSFRPEINYFACIFEDITDQKQTAEERAKLQDQLYHAQKMEDIGRLTSGVAHDFNNNLTAIIGCSQILLNKLSNNSELRYLAEMVNSAGEKAAALTRSLLTFSRKQPLEMRPVDVSTIITNIQKLLVRLIGEDIEVKVELCDTPLFVKGDSGHLEQVIMNLATNARDALPAGGTIRIKTELRKLDNNFMSIYGWGLPGKYAVISFSDNGTGITGDQKAKIFEPFYTSKEEGKGTGLGLSIVHGIIQQHGGHIQVESEPSQGTTFVIFLPFLSSTGKNRGQVVQYLPQRGIETILVCEDEDSVRRLVRLVLEEYGYQVIEAVDGQDAVVSYLHNQDRIDLVILDVVMPKKNGMAVYAEISAVRPDQRVLLTSGYTPESIERSGIFKMGVPFVSKPITPGLLLKKVREVLDA